MVVVAFLQVCSACHGRRRAGHWRELAHSMPPPTPTQTTTRSRINHVNMGRDAREIVTQTMCN